MRKQPTINPSKNALWAAYRCAAPMLRAEIILELKKIGLFRYWWETASKADYDLRMAKAPLRDVFVRLMPESAPMFGLKAPSKPRKSAPENGTLSLFN
ncbi:hypothetical protein DYU11_21195 [Fibrisoma montanum]|uniref:Uncharacterized protein n=1 Tax=Fibrisoma montanum TaxID=2305895 RepID=A0A418M4H7_9BACT|nr:hypothetical protein DYU11_21195 [Fibrisoma montanum]